MKTLIYAALALAISVPAFAQDRQSLDAGLCPMPEEIKAKIEELRQYGDRFEKAIAAIEAEWEKPTWVGGVECPDDF